MGIAALAITGNCHADAPTDVAFLLRQFHKLVIANLLPSPRNDFRQRAGHIRVIAVWLIAQLAHMLQTELQRINAKALRNIICMALGHKCLLRNTIAPHCSANRDICIDRLAIPAQVRAGVDLAKLTANVTQDVVPVGGIRASVMDDKLLSGNDGAVLHEASAHPVNAAVAGPRRC